MDEIQIAASVPAILMVCDHLPEYYWHLHSFSNQKIPDIKGFERKIRGDGTGRHPFVLIEKDCFLLTSIAIFIKAVQDPIIQQQVPVVFQHLLESMVRVPFIKVFIHGPSFLEPITILNLLDFSVEIRNEPNNFRRNDYLKTVFDTIEDWLDPHYLH